jgi:hypothetical protein
MCTAMMESVDMDFAKACNKEGRIYLEENRLQEMGQKALFIQEHMFGSDSAVGKETRAQIALESKSAPSAAGAPVKR